jgi:hypothetical protein
MSSLGRPTGFRTDMAGSQIAGRSHPKHSQERGPETVAIGNAAGHTHELHSSTNTSFVNRGRLSLPTPDISGSRPRKYQRGPSDHIPLEIEAEPAALVIWSTGPRLSKKRLFRQHRPKLIRRGRFIASIDAGSASPQLNWVVQEIFQFLEQSRHTGVLLQRDMVLAR